LRGHGLAFDPALVAAADGSNAAAEEAMRDLLDLEHPPSAVIVGDNPMTIGAMRALRDAHVEVPRDLALVAFDDLAWADLFHPRLTTMAPPTTELGERAVTLLLERLADPDRPVRRVRLRPTFVHRLLRAGRRRVGQGRLGLRQARPAARSSLPVGVARPQLLRGLQPAVADPVRDQVDGGDLLQRAVGLGHAVPPSAFDPAWVVRGRVVCVVPI
jgi:Periplasmic binding protein-like domain